MKKIIIGMLLTLQGSIGISYATGCDYPNVDGVKWYHISDEKRAIYLEVYNIAAEKIKAELESQKLQKGQWGIILDIDETTLDNSWDEYENYKTYKFNEDEFKKGKAKALPGVKMLTDLVHNLGGYVSFVTNRNAKNTGMVEATVENLKQEGIYFDQILFAAGVSKEAQNKNPRFEAVISGEYSDDIIVTNKLPAHEVIAYFGDNIQDFPNMTQDNMRKVDDDGYSMFGKKYFIVPNPTYGSWQ
ncbi:HAD family acid phosphatase [Francisella frigiditurris]|uniref:HAD super, subIIIB family protein n=1 Tax=Francisella frigiditurris TaxID=1542390 RepID=A0A1J0KVP2_9GAMM|nr:HAD family acid phosphatase [Francisella frigiditurris]APC97738.1 HAD super, subIIIB family protein [Francisella frigiditurris]